MRAGEGVIARDGLFEFCDGLIGVTGDTVCAADIHVDGGGVSGLCFERGEEVRGVGFVLESEPDAGKSESVLEAGVDGVGGLGFLERGFVLAGFLEDAGEQRVGFCGFWLVRSMALREGFSR